MTATALTPVNLPAQNATAGVDSGATAADTVNGNSFPLTGDEILLAWNTHATTTYHVTISSVASQVLGRTGDIATDALTAGQIKVYPRFQLEGWRNASDNSLHFSADNAAIKFIVLHTTK